MKHIITVLGLLILSVLYLFEMDFAQVTTMNWVALGVIAATFIYVIVALVLSRERRRQARKAKQSEYFPPSNQNVQP